MFILFLITTFVLLLLQSECADTVATLKKYYDCADDTKPDGYANVKKVVDHGGQAYFIVADDASRGIAYLLASICNTYKSVYVKFHYAPLQVDIYSAITLTGSEALTELITKLRNTQTTVFVLTGRHGHEYGMLLDKDDANKLDATVPDQGHYDEDFAFMSRLRKAENVADVGDTLPDDLIRTMKAAMINMRGYETERAEREPNTPERKLALIIPWCHSFFAMEKVRNEASPSGVTSPEWQYGKILAGDINKKTIAQVVANWLQRLTTVNLETIQELEFSINDL